MPADSLPRPNEANDGIRRFVAEAVDPVIEATRGSLLAQQKPDGHWVFELEADATIPAEYIMYGHYLDEVDAEEEARCADYLRRIQGAHGGWPLFHDGDLDVSASVKAYFALKLAGDDIEAPHMRRAREGILARGGAARANVFTRTALALFGQVPWRAVPTMPVEIMLLPRWFPFHMSKVSYWSRTVIAPLLVLMSLKPRAKNPKGVHIRELFMMPPEAERHYLRSATPSAWASFFLGVDRVLKVVEPFAPKAMRRRAVERAMAFVHERLNGEDGLGAIFPAMVNAVLAMELLGYAKDDPRLVTAKRAIKNLLTRNGARDYCQPCVSPIWDTGLAVHALMEAGERGDGEAIRKAAAWMADRQILDVKGDWAIQAPNLRPGGWAFQYRNDHYPDVDDTAVVAMALDRAGGGAHRENIARATEWIIGMQSRNGGWGAFDIDNDHQLLNNIPFADHGALLDPPTADVSARCLSMLAQLGHGKDHPAVSRAIAYLKREQEADGSWFGRWGTNYIYGTWSVLCALNAVGEDMRAPYVRKAVDWLLARQRADGGWGEDGATYWTERRAEVKASTPSQTAWATLGLMAAGEVDNPAVRRGMEYLVTQPREGGRWRERHYNAVGFPRVFYLLYHGYAAYFPLWALARYRNLQRGNAKAVVFGM